MANLTGGTIRFSFYNGFTPASDNSLDFLTAVDGIVDLNNVTLDYSELLLATGNRYQYLVESVVDSQTNISSLRLSLTADEPNTLSLLSLSLAALGLLRRRVLKKTGQEQ